MQCMLFLISIILYLFLNYLIDRMPTAIGDFISKEVYFNMLHSWNEHQVQSPLAAQFINIHSSEEPEKTSFRVSSFKNTVVSDFNSS